MSPRSRAALGVDLARTADLATAMSDAWVSFARTGNPSHPGLPPWRPFDPQRRATMVFNTRPRLVDDPYGFQTKVLRVSRGGANVARQLVRRAHAGQEDTNVRGSHIRCEVPIRHVL